VETTVAQRGMFWPQLCDGKADEGEVAKLYNVQGTPDLFVIDRAGSIAVRLGSAATLDRHLAEVVADDSFPRTQRDAWQRPVQVMETLGIKAGSAVADVGAGSGYFTFRLAGRVGSKGKVYAEDIDAKSLEQIQERKLTQVVTIRGTEDDPKLPAGTLDAVLVVDAFHEFRSPPAMLTAFYNALKPGGRFGVLDTSAEAGKSRAEYMDHHNLPHEIVIEEAARAGLRLVSFEPDFARPGDSPFYFAVFEKPKR
jgi:predicted methyltransferase